jgi:hypothetical protein
MRSARDLYGVVVEEISYAGDGGLYPELIRNQAFMDPATPARWAGPAGLPRVPGKFGSARRAKSAERQQ